jgi:hypothetical protein
MQVWVKFRQKSLMNRTQAFALLSEKLDQWEATSKPDGYTYEHEFVKLMQELNQELLQLSLGELPKDRNAKKK